jgi:hypothetical protein
MEKREREDKGRSVGLAVGTLVLILISNKKKTGHREWKES